jgi:hypothetical protein
VIHVYSFLTIQTIKQITTKVPSNPYPSMLSPIRSASILKKVSSSTVGGSQDEFCAVPDTAVAYGLGQLSCSAASNHFCTTMR